MDFSAGHKLCESRAPSVWVTTVSPGPGTIPGVQWAQDKYLFRKNVCPSSLANLSYLQPTLRDPPQGPAKALGQCFLFQRPWRVFDSSCHMQH